MTRDIMCLECGDWNLISTLAESYECGSCAHINKPCMACMKEVQSHNGYCDVCHDDMIREYKREPETNSER